MKEEYKGFTIEYIEHINVFKAKIGESDYSNVNLQNVRDHIDDLDKKNYVRTSVIIEGGWRDNDYKEVTTTSEFQEGKDIYMWVTDANRKRSKHRAKSVYKANYVNRSKITDMIIIKDKISQLKNQIDAIRDSLEIYEPQIKIEQ
jgi:hypothetical protein